MDGDTIRVTLPGGKMEIVRLIGVYTPETVAPGQPVGCDGREASAYLKALVEGRDVELERDVSERDRYGRLLRYVWLADGTMVNGLLLRDGYASVATFPPDVAWSRQFIEVEAYAHDLGRGLWSACGTR